VKIGPQIAYVLVELSLEAERFMDRCLKFNHETGASMASYKGVYKDMQKKPEQLKINSFFTKPSLSPSIMYCPCFITMTTSIQEH
jgi:hypothetical protein